MSQNYDLEEIRKRISLPSLLAHYKIQPDGSNMINCPFHDDSTPSMRVWEDHAYCYGAGCNKWADVVSFVAKFEKLPYNRAVNWLLEREGILPEAVLLERPAVREYRGPVPLQWVRYWNGMLADEKREYLHNRLISDETIDTNLIGYRPDSEAYSIPFWRGVPQHSDIDIVQLRADPAVRREARKYSGLPEGGYNKPSILNYHLLNPRLVVIVFGTIDALLGAQDGIPMLSTNGATVFNNPDRAESQWLIRVLRQTEKVLIVPDSQPSEFAAAHALSNIIPGSQVGYMPRAWGTKDYNEFRLHGGTADEFWKEVIRMPRNFIKGPQGTLWPVDDDWLAHDDHLPLLGQIIARISEGDGDEALRLTQQFIHLDLPTYASSAKIMAWNLARACEYLLAPIRPVFSPEDRKAMGQAFSNCNTGRDIMQVMVEWSNLAASRLGGF